MSRPSRNTRLGAVFWTAVATAGAVPAPASDAVSLHRVVLADLARGAAYVAAPGRAVESIELASGRVAWRTDAASVPLALSENGLLARGEDEEPRSSLPVAVLDPRRDGRAVFSATVPLADDARALASDDAARSFRIDAYGAAGAFVARWVYREAAVHGVAPPPGEAPPERVRDGVFRVDPERGRVETLEAAPPKPGRGEHAPRPVGRFLVSVDGGRGGPLTLRRQDARSGRRLPDHRLLDNALLSLVSADGRHLLAVDEAAAGRPEQPEYVWSIFALESGERLGEMRRPFSATPFVVFEDRLIFVPPPRGRRHEGRWIEDPLSLCAVKLPDGEPQWERPLRDLEYRGALPPTS